MAWPTRVRAEIIRRAIAAVFLLPLLVALTTPLLLVSLVERDLKPESFSASAQLGALLQPFIFMELGGRWFLPLVAALLCLWLTSSRDRDEVTLGCQARF